VVRFCDIAYFRSDEFIDMLFDVCIDMPLFKYDIDKDGLPFDLMRPSYYGNFRHRIIFFHCRFYLGGTHTMS